jgi:mannose-binding lectin 2
MDMRTATARSSLSNTSRLPLLGLLALGHAALQPTRSFRQPFTSLDHAGQRTVPHWAVGGSATIQKSFVRLTPDRQSKRGYMWNEQSLGSEDFTVVMQLRISGQGARWFGDGVGLWLTESQSYAPGLVHGFAAESHKGVGVVVDTFKNDGHSEHRDIAILVNGDGATTREAMQAKAYGCNVVAGERLRHHEKRDDFAPAASTARVKLQYRASTGALRISVDAASSAEWRECATVSLREEGLTAGWAASSHLGVTASTGSLADNHDALALSTFDSADDTAVAAEDLAYSAATRPLAEQHNGDEVAVLNARLEELQVTLEHQLHAMGEALQNSIAKLRAQEEGAEKRIEELERQLAAQIEAHVEERVAGAQNTIRANVSDTVMQQLHSVSSSVEETVNAHLAVNTAHAGGWKLPFLGLVMSFAAAGVGAKKKYTEMKKTHLL